MDSWFLFKNFALIDEKLDILVIVISISISIIFHYHYNNNIYYYCYYIVESQA